MISGLTRLSAVPRLPDGQGGASEEQSKPYWISTVSSTAACDEEMRQTRKS